MCPASLGLRICSPGLLTMTVTMSTLIDDRSHTCLASGPAGMSDGVMTPQKKTSEVWLNVERHWENLKIHCEMTACRDLCIGHNLRKKKAEAVAISGSSRTDV